MAGPLDSAVVDAWAVQDVDPSDVRCPAPSLESDRGFLLSASAGVEEREDAVQALPHLLRDALQSAANQLEPEGEPRAEFPAEDARQSAARELRRVVDSVLAPLAGESSKTGPTAQALQASRA